MFKKTKAPSLREIERETGVPLSTLSRINRGEDFMISTAKKILPLLDACPCCGKPVTPHSNKEGE